MANSKTTNYSKSAIQAALRAQDPAQAMGQLASQWSLNASNNGQSNAPRTWMSNVNHVLQNLHYMGVPFAGDLINTINEADPTIRQQKLQNLNQQFNAFRNYQQNGQFTNPAYSVNTSPFTQNQGNVSQVDPRVAIAQYFASQKRGFGI